MKCLNCNSSLYFSITISHEEVSYNVIKMAMATGNLSKAMEWGTVYLHVKCSCNSTVLPEEVKNLLEDNFHNIVFDKGEI